jgi:signal peptidase II
VSRKAAVFWPVVLGVVIADVATKQLAVARLSPPYIPHDVVGRFVRLTLAYNPGAAFSMSLGSASRWGFAALAVIALSVLYLVYRNAEPDDVVQALALALIAGGALGNLADRLRSARGVVDFIDIGTASWRFWTFNVADMGVTCGAILLAWTLWRRGRHVPTPAAPEKAHLSDEQAPTA